MALHIKLSEKDGTEFAKQMGAGLQRIKKCVANIM